MLYIFSLWVLDQDFGSISSNTTLAYQTNNNQTRILRVNAYVPFNHSERIRAPHASNLLGEFYSFAGLDSKKRRLMPRRPAFLQDEGFPLKTLFAHRGGLDDDDIIYTMLARRRRLAKVLPRRKDQAIDRAFTASLVIQTIVLTYPNYLCEAENEYDFDQYRSFNLYLIRPLWIVYEEANDLHIQFKTVSERQTTAIHVCKPFEDVAATFTRAKPWTGLEDFDTR
ncbi:hypothetical protein HD806DRAFT_550097 [Xylariaceae sp. AK1471]|nr:hypothetical protein HD806DRAFT_550097 [Xylariaceae sp. AK1471]